MSTLTLEERGRFGRWYNAQALDDQRFLQSWDMGLQKDREAAADGGYKKLSVTRPGPFKADWLKALRGGHYLQAKGKLRMTVFPDVAPNEPLTQDAVGKVGYCCLGVGCNIISHRKDWEPSGITWNWRDISSGSLDLPWIDKNAADRLASVNDDGIGFAVIADWIEVNL